MVTNKQYTTNYKEQIKLYKRVRRESKLWSKTLWLRISIWAIIPIMFFTLNIFIKMDTGDIFYDYMPSVIITLILASTVVVTTFVILKISPIKTIWRYSDIVFIENNVIVNIFLEYTNNIMKAPSEYGDMDYQQKIEINIKDIRKIILNKEQGYVVIYATMKYTEYEDYELGIIEYEQNISGEDSYRVFYDYIEEFDDFVNTIVEVSGVVPEIDNSNRILIGKRMKYYKRTQREQS